MVRTAGVVNLFATPYEDWSNRKTTGQEALNLVKNEGCSVIEALQVKDRLIEVVSTHNDAAARMLRLRADNGLEGHIDRALDVSAEYRDLLNLMPRDVPDALSSYQGEFSENDWEKADKAIRAHGVELSAGQFLFHGGHWASDIATFTTSRPFSTSFCPQVALRNAEWRGKAYDVGRVDLMVVCVVNPQTEAYAYCREGNHGQEKEVVFASGAQLTRLRETYITDIPVSKMTSNLRQLQMMVPAYVINVEIN